MTSRHPWKTGAVAALTIATFGLAGCFGSSDDDNGTPAPTTSVPGSASQSATGFIEYLKLLVASSADTLEPVDVAAVTPPADETGEPQVIN